MPRAAPISPVDAKMYRHFAIASLVITAGLAMFANSERRQALGGDLANESRQQEKQSPKTKRVLKFTDNRTTMGSFGEEAGPRAVGRPMTLKTRADIAGTGPELMAGDRIRLTSDDAALLPENAVNGLPPGMTPEEIEEWRRLRQKKRIPAAAASEPSASELEAMVAASKARSTTRGT